VWPDLSGHTLFISDHFSVAKKKTTTPPATLRSLGPVLTNMVSALPPDRFLTQLHKMFERTKGAGAVTLTTKRSACFEMMWRGSVCAVHCVCVLTRTAPSLLLCTHTGNMKNKRARKPDEVRRENGERDRRARKEQRVVSRSLFSIGAQPAAPFSTSVSFLLPRRDSRALADFPFPSHPRLPHTSDQSLRLSGPGVGRQGQDQHDGARGASHGLELMEWRLGCFYRAVRPFTFYLTYHTQVSAREHSRFIESYGTILKAHMDGLKKKEKGKKKK